jgi:acyl carrier protein
MAKKRSVEAELKELVAQQFQVDITEVTSNSRFREDFDADSLDIVELAMSLEEKFDIEIDGEDGERLTTVQAALELVEEKMAALKTAVETQTEGG